MRYVIVLADMILGGAERQALLLAKYLKDDPRNDVQVLTISRTGSTSAIPLCESYGVSWRNVPIDWPSNHVGQVSNLAKLCWHLRSASPDVILPYIMFQNVACASVWRGTGARLCVWNQRDEGRGRMGPHLERWAVRQTPLFISNSTHGARFLTETLGAASERVAVVHNGVELATPEMPSGVWRERLALGPDAFAACMVANFNPYKDHGTLLRAWRIVVDSMQSRGMRAVLVLAGQEEGVPTASLRSLASDLGIADNIRFLGHVADISGLLSAVDLTVFSSYYEGCPNGVLEGMAAGLTVVASDIEGIREAVGPSGCTHLFPPGNAEALADKVIEVALRPDIRANEGAVNRRRIQDEFGGRATANKMVQLFEKHLGQR